MPASDDCPFCAIVSGDAPASVVHETEDTLAFLDLNPATEGHTLVIPKTHGAGLADVTTADLQTVTRVGQQVAAALRASDEIRTDGVNLFLADGEAAGQEVFHLHLHVIPRYAGDGVTVEAGQERAEREALESVAADIRGRL